MPPQAATGSAPETLQVPYSRIATFVRQVTHDVRNNLNSMDLQAAYATELITDPEAQAEVRRIRTLIQTAARQLQAISANFQSATPSLVTYTASILIEDLQDRLKKSFPEGAGEVQWEVNLGEEAVEVDVEQLFGALTELFRNAFQFRAEGQPISVRVLGENGRFVFELSEGKPPPETAPETWGAEPFISSRRSGYGLGLFRVRRALKQHEGDLAIFYDSTRAQLRTRVSLPFAPATPPS